MGSQQGGKKGIIAAKDTINYHSHHFSQEREEAVGDLLLSADDQEGEKKRGGPRPSVFPAQIDHQKGKEGGYW